MEDRLKAHKKGFDDGLEYGENKNPYENNGMNSHNGKLEANSLK